MPGVFVQRIVEDDVGQHRRSHWTFRNAGIDRVPVTVGDADLQADGVEQGFVRDMRVFALRAVGCELLPHARHCRLPLRRQTPGYQLRIHILRVWGNVHGHYRRCWSYRMGLWTDQLPFRSRHDWSTASERHRWPRFTIWLRVGISGHDTSYASYTAFLLWDLLHASSAAVPATICRMALMLLPSSSAPTVRQTFEHTFGVRPPWLFLATI